MKSGSRTRRWVMAVVVGVLASLLAGCAAPRPAVTFYGDHRAATTGPALWCQVNYASFLVQCQPWDQDQDQVVRIDLDPGQPVNVDVPGPIATSPWLVYAQYVTATGKVGELRSPVFSDGTMAYTMRPLTPADRLIRVEVQTDLLPASDGEFLVAHSWVLVSGTAAAGATAAGTKAPGGSSGSAMSSGPGGPSGSG